MKMLLVLISLILFAGIVLAPEANKENPAIVGNIDLIVGGITIDVDKVVSATGPKITFGANGEPQYSPITLEVHYGNQQLFDQFMQFAQERNNMHITVYYRQANQNLITRYDYQRAEPLEWRLKQNPETRMLTEEYTFKYFTFTRRDA